MVAVILANGAHDPGPWLWSAAAWIAYSVSVVIGAMLGAVAVWAPGVDVFFVQTRLHAPGGH